jgi:alpha-amylase
LTLAFICLQDENASKDGAFVSFPDNVEALKAALLDFEARALAAEKAENQALQALAAIRSKSQDSTKNLVQNTEGVVELEAVKDAYRTELDKMSKAKKKVDLQLFEEKQESLDLAVRVEKIAELAISNATARIADEANLKVAAAETAAAEAIFQVEERVRHSADEASASVLMDARLALEEALAAAKTAKGQAEKAQACLVDQVGLQNELAELQAKLLLQEEALLSVGRHLQVAKGETERFRIQLDEAQNFMKAATARVAAAEGVVLDVQKAAEQAAKDREESSQRAMDAFKKAARAKEDADKVAYKSEIDSLQDAISVSQKANEARRLAEKSRY